MQKVKKEELQDFASHQLGELLSKPGKILYSSHETLSPGDIYLLGYNPGGVGGPPISNSIKTMLADNINSYLDESWSNKTGVYKRGCAPLQRRVYSLTKDLGYDLRKVCSSNLIFAQSVNANQISVSLADICWPVHEAIISIVKPKTILVFGNGNPSPFMYLHNKFSGNIDYLNSGHGDWKIKSFLMDAYGRETLIIGFPHFSYYSPINKDEMIERVKLKIMRRI